VLTVDDWLVLVKAAMGDWSTVKTRVGSGLVWQTCD
jgi:hypothetical protein